VLQPLVSVLHAHLTLFARLATPVTIQAEMAPRVIHVLRLVLSVLQILITLLVLPGIILLVVSVSLVYLHV